MRRSAYFPDYSGYGFVNLVASLVEACGGTPRHPPLVSLPVAEIRCAGNVVFLIVDGLGDNYLEAHGQGGQITRHRRGASRMVSWRKIINSRYNAYHCGRAERLAYDNLAGFVEQTVNAVKSGPRHKFVYAYWPAFDTLAHRYGVASAQVRAHFAALDAAFGELLSRLAGSDTLLVLTADHGFIDSPPEESLELPPALSAMLRFPLCGERRVAFCHVQDQKAFLEKAKSLLENRSDVRPSQELLDEGWFGSGRAHPRFAERIGEVALVMTGRGTVKDWVCGESRHLHIGNHGGMSEDEMKIPLVVAQA